MPQICINYFDHDLADDTDALGVAVADEHCAVFVNEDTVRAGELALERIGPRAIPANTRTSD